MKDMWLSAQYKAAFHWRGDEPDLVFLVLLPLAAGIGSVARLGLQELEPVAKGV